jgi:hypothetical protein
MLENYPLLELSGSSRYSSDGQCICSQCRWLNVNFPAHWIGRGGPLALPSCFPDLTLLWGHAKDHAHSRRVSTLDELKTHTTAAVTDVTRTSYSATGKRITGMHSCRWHSLWSSSPKNFSTLKKSCVCWWIKRYKQHTRLLLFLSCRWVKSWNFLVEPVYFRCNVKCKTERFLFKRKCATVAGMKCVVFNLLWWIFRLIT